MEISRRKKGKANYSSVAPLSNNFLEEKGKPEERREKRKAASILFLFLFLLIFLPSFLRDRSLPISTGKPKSIAADEKLSSANRRILYHPAVHEETHPNKSIRSLPSNITLWQPGENGVGLIIEVVEVVVGVGHGVSPVPA